MLNLRVEQRVVSRQNSTAGITEDYFGTLGHEALDNDLGSGQFLHRRFLRTAGLKPSVFAEPKEYTTLCVMHNAPPACGINQTAGAAWVGRSAPARRFAPGFSNRYASPAGTRWSTIKPL